MKKIKLISLLLAISTIMIGVCGCMEIGLSGILGHSYEEYVSSVEKALNEKYSLSFKVKSIGGAYGTYDDSTMKVECYCEEGDYANMHFMAEIKKTI